MIMTKCGTRLTQYEPITTCNVGAHDDGDLIDYKFI